VVRYDGVKGEQRTGGRERYGHGITNLRGIGESVKVGMSQSKCRKLEKTGGITVFEYGTVLFWAGGWGDEQRVAEVTALKPWTVESRVDEWIGLWGLRRFMGVYWQFRSGRIVEIQM
jgi:hypothetical protein